MKYNADMVAAIGYLAFVIILVMSLLKVLIK